MRKMNLRRKQDIVEQEANTAKQDQDKQETVLTGNRMHSNRKQDAHSHTLSAD